jgi:hypothetical protein
MGKKVSCSPVFLLLFLIFIFSETSFISPFNVSGTHILSTELLA